MPRECSVCAHAAHREIDAALITGRSCRSLAAEYGLDHRAVDRHRTNHLPITIRRAAREAIAREEATSATQADNEETVASIDAASPEASLAVPVASPIASAAPSAGRARRRGMELDPAAPAARGETVAPGLVATNVGADRTASAPAGSLDLHAAIVGLQGRALTILAQAEADGDAKTALVAIRETRGVLETLARLQERQGTTGAAVPLAQAPEWHRTRTAIVAALAVHPEARIAVVEALAGTGALN